MKRYTDPKLEHEIVIEVPEDVKGNLRLCFYQEHDNTQHEFEKLARMKKTDVFNLYAQHLFNTVLATKFEDVLASQQKAFKSAAICLMAQGKAKTLDEAYAIMGYTPVGRDREL